MNVAPTQTFSIQALSSPIHLEQVQNLLDDGQVHRLSALNNQYSSDKQITWPEQGTRSNATVRAPFVTLSLLHAYVSLGLTTPVFKSLSGGSSSPNPPTILSGFCQSKSGL